jgi:hypothetical protein
VPVKNSENVQGAEVKEETRAAVMSYATLSENPYNRGPNIYENIAETNTYDTPYEAARNGRRDSGDSGHYEPSPTPTRQESNNVTINGVAVR